MRVCVSEYCACERPTLPQLHCKIHEKLKETPKRSEKKRNK